ncbi:MAG TPA: RcpC/CpaB family pilus assembly protein [Acidimicrobiales bacterium]|nr:RcpC/CpaB family pilus assembly protein [Acidimicrobiales bacterium]
MSITGPTTLGLPGQTSGNGAPPTERGRRLARGHWVALTLGLLAFLVNIAVLRDRSEVVQVPVAREAIGPATEITEGMVRFVEVPADSPLASGMVAQDALAGGGLYARRQIAAEEPLVEGAVVDDVPDDGQRSMSVPVPREHAAGGTLGVGDRVDVIYMADRPVFAVTDAEVLAIGDETSGSNGRPAGEYHLVLAVDAAETLRLAAALDSGKLDVVRATGAPPAPLGPEDDAPPPPADADADAGAADEETTGD